MKPLAEEFREIMRCLLDDGYDGPLPEGGEGLLEQFCCAHADEIAAALEFTAEWKPVFDGELQDQRKRIAALESDVVSARSEIAWLRGTIAALEADVETLRHFRLDATAATIHAHRDNAGGLRYDEVPAGIRRLGDRIVALEAETAKQRVWFEAALESTIAKNARVDQRVRALGNILDHWEQIPNDIRSDPGFYNLESALRLAQEAIEHEDEP